MEHHIHFIFCQFQPIRNEKHNSYYHNITCTKSCYFIYFRMPKWSPIYNWRCEYSLIHSIVSTPHVIQPRAVTKWYRFLCLFHAPYGCHGNIYLTEFTNIFVQSYFKNTISRLLQLLNFLESGQHYGTPYSFFFCAFYIMLSSIHIILSSIQIMLSSIHIMLKVFTLCSVVFTLYSVIFGICDQLL